MYIPMEPGFYRCKDCHRAWSRMEYKSGLSGNRNPPKVCPGCGSTNQGLDQERESAYVKEVYAPITQAIASSMEKKS